MKFGSVLRVEHEENTRGRDFIVGDLHGAIGLLNKFMKFIGFDKEKDRMFSVGDLIDRGPHSFKTLKLIYEPWFFVTPGNHEEMFYSFIDPYGDRDYIMAQSFWRNGGNWVSDYDVIDKKDELKHMAELLATMPRIRTIKGKNKVHMIHAEFPVNANGSYGFMASPFKEPLTDAMIENDTICAAMCNYQSADGNFSSWGRSIFGAYYNVTLNEQYKVDPDARYFESPDLSLIVCGHTIVRKPILYGKVLNIDTGAWFSPKPLTFYSVKEQCIYQVTPDSEDLIDVEPFVVTSGK